VRRRRSERTRAASPRGGKTGTGGTRQAAAFYVFPADCFIPIRSSSFNSGNENNKLLVFL